MCEAVSEDTETLGLKLGLDFPRPALVLDKVETVRKPVEWCAVAAKL